MSTNKSCVSQASSYTAMGEFWDTHDLGDYWEQTAPVEFEVDIQSEVQFYALDHTLSTKVTELARQRGISAETLVNLWIQEKLKEQQLHS